MEPAGGESEDEGSGRTELSGSEDVKPPGGEGVPIRASL